MKQYTLNFQDDTDLDGEMMTSSSLEDSHVNPTQVQESDLGKMTSDISSRRCLESFKRLSQPSLWAKTFMDSLIGTEAWCSKKCVLTWRVLGTQYNRYYCQLRASVRHTTECEYGLLPTPMAMNRNATVEQTQARQEKYGGTVRGMYLENFAAMGMLPTPQASDYVQTVQDNNYSLRHLEHISGWVVGMLPTPTAFDYNSARTQQKWEEDKKKYAEKEVNLQMPLKQMARNEMLPTPARRDYKDNVGNGRDAPSIGVTRGYSLGQKINSMLPTPQAQEGKKISGNENQDSMTKRVRQITGTISQLNPRFVAEMMGFPTDWTELPFLSGDNSQ